jgi:hypothetical protein
MRVTDDLERIFSLGDVGSEQETRRYQVSLLYRVSCPVETRTFCRRLTSRKTHLDEEKRYVRHGSR